MADMERINKLESGEDVTVITKGQYQIVDVAGGLKIPPLTEATLPLSPFIMNQLLLGTLVLADSPEAPKAEGKALKLDDLRYTENRVPAAKSRPAKMESSDNSSTHNDALTSESAPARRNRRSESKE